MEQEKPCGKCEWFRNYDGYPYCGWDTVYPACWYIDADTIQAHLDINCPCWEAKDAA